MKFLAYILFGILLVVNTSSTETETKVIKIKDASLIHENDNDNTNRDLQSVNLETKWRLDRPTFSYDSLEFDLIYNISDFVKDGNSRYSVFDGHQCQEGDNDITDSQTYLTSLLREDLTPVGDGTGSRTIQVTLNIDPEQIAKSPVYEDGTTQGYVYFCVRFGIWQTSDTDEFEPTEVNFIETPVLLIVDLVDGFNIDTPQLTNADKIAELAKQGNAVNGYICDNEENLVTQTTKKQGSTIRVCVEPTPKTQAEGAYLRYIESFTFVRLNTTQVAIEPGTFGVAADQLTEVSCEPGATLCSFETLLGAEFFDSAGLVRGDGLAFLQLGQEDYLNLGTGENEAGENGRRRARVSELDQALESPTRFRFEIFVLPVEEEDSSANAIAGLVATSFISIAMAMFSTMFVW